MRFISDGSGSIKYIQDEYANPFRGYKEVWINGKNTICLIKEYCLRACVNIDSFYILFASEDYPRSNYSPWSETSSSDDPLAWADLHEDTIYLTIKGKCSIKHQ